MNLQVRSLEGVFTFQIRRDDLGPLVVGLVGNACDARSPFHAAITRYSAGEIRQPSAEVLAFAGEDGVDRAIRILANPDFVINNRAGGGRFPLGFNTACHAPSIDEAAFVVLSPSLEGAYLVQVFEDRWQFLAWWLAENAGPVNEPTANLIPPPVRFESLIYVLHTVDLFRRMTMQSELDLDAAGDLSLAPEDFSETLKKSVVNRDFRWLVPCFLGLTPGIDLLEFDADAAHFETLARYDFLRTVANSGGDDGRLVFGAAGRAMGTEFQHTWFHAAGFETLARVDGKWTIVNRGFLAPTALANHLVLFDVGDEPANINHQAMTRNALDAKIVKLFEVPDLVGAGAVSSEPARSAEIADTLTIAPIPKIAAAPKIAEEPVATSEPETAGTFAPETIADVRGSSKEAGPMHNDTPVKPREQLQTCPNCMAMIRSGQDVCPRCKKRLSSPEATKPQAAVCKNCGKELVAGKKFCTTCGTAV